MKFRILSTVMFTLMLVAGTVHAQRRGWGAGIILGEPTGLNAKAWLSGSSALDMAAAWSFTGGSRNGGTSAIQLHVDYILHNVDVIHVRTGQLPIFYGIGGRVIAGDAGIVGLRIPVGLDYQFAEAPFDIFVEVVPELDLAPSTDFDLAGALGARFWFR